MSTRIVIEKDGERWVGVLPSDVFCKGDTVSEFIRKVEQIISRDETEKKKLEAENAKLREEYDKLIKHKNELIFVCDDYKEENAKMREALKPVLEVKMSAERINSYRIHELHVETFSAVRKAQEIMKGEKE